MKKQKRNFFSLYFKISIFGFYVNFNEMYSLFISN